MLLSLVIGCQSPKEQHLRIAAASNLRFCLPQIAEDFEGKFNQECELIFASSGKLCAQIEAGAPFDLFISADKYYPDHLHKLGLSTAPAVYARGRLVLWSTALPKTDLIPTLSNPDGPKVAIADSVLAPYGKAAHQYMLNNDLHEILNHRLVIGESVSQVNQFVTSKAASMGFTSLSTVVSNRQFEGSHHELDIREYEAIEQCAAVVVQSDLTTEAHSFIQFLKSETVQKELECYGYYPVNTRFEKLPD